MVDTSGRVVRRLSGSNLSGSEPTASWDGLNDSGAPVPPGVYAVKLSGAGQSESAKIVILR